MQAEIPVAALTLLGEYLMTLDTGQIKYVKFKTVDRTERWVRAEDITIKNSQ
jgi:hypothetical protein